MTVNIPTTLVILTMICATIGAIFVYVSLQVPNTGIPRRAGVAILMIAGELTLILLRGEIPNRLSIDVANALLLAGIGLVWSTIGVFDGKPPPVATIVAGAVVWLVACQVTAFYENIGYRIGLFSLIAGIYCSVGGYELLTRDSESRVRRPLAILCLIHSGFVFFRGAYALVAPPPPTLFDGNWVWGLLLAEAAVAIVGGTLLSAGLVRERAERELRRSADTDSLTGVLNRRAFFDIAAMILDTAREGRRGIALLLFDLDHFKAINDRHGHLVGDATLQAFTRIVHESVRTNDLIGRIGGEEFAVLLDGANLQVAEAIGERIRAGLSAESLLSAFGGVDATVSVGIAVGTELSVEGLFAEADQALYAAKRGGRDQVKTALALAS